MQVDLRFKEIADHATTQLTQEFPAIAGDSGRQATERLQQAMVGEGQKLHEHLMTLCDAQTKRLRQVINEFPLPDVTKTDSDALQPCSCTTSSPSPITSCWHGAPPRWTPR